MRRSPIGWIAVKHDQRMRIAGALRAQVEGVRVASSERGNALGVHMIEWAIDQARRWGCQLIQLTSDKARVDAHRFYESVGFTATHEGFKLTL